MKRYFEKYHLLQAEQNREKMIFHSYLLYKRSFISYDNEASMILYDCYTD